MRGEIVEGDWVFVQWLYPGEQKYTAFKELTRIENLIRGEGLKGWYAKSEKDHPIMHLFLKRFNAEQYAKDEHALYFKKELENFPLLFERVKQYLEMKGGV